MKQNRSYDTFYDPNPKAFCCCNRCSDALPLIVNCAGSIYSNSPFNTINPTGRLDYYLMYLVEGELCYRFDNETIVLGSGSVVIFPPNCGYEYNNVSQGKVYYLWAHFTGRDVAQILSDYGLSDLPLIGNIGDDGRRTEIRFERLWDTMIRKKSFFERSAGLKLEEILLHIGRRLLPSGASEASLSDAVAYMHCNLRKKITLEELAALENLSVSRFSDVFREFYGQSPIRYLIGMRIKMACELLTTTDLSVSEIGEMVGYGDISLFTKQFKKLMGVAPTHFRNDEGF